MATLYTYAPILQSVQDACTQLNLQKPTGVYDTLDQNAIFMGSAINLIGPMLQDSFAWQQFRFKFDCIGDNLRAAYDLPAGFSRFIDNTGWSNANRRPVIIINAQNWAASKSWVSNGFFINPACRIFNDQLVFFTPPAVGETISFEYISRNWVIDADNITLLKNRCSKNGDTPMHDDRLIMLGLKVKWLENKGMNTSGPQQDFNERFSELTARNQMAQVLSLNGGSGGFRYLNGANMPNTGYGM